MKHCLGFELHIHSAAGTREWSGKFSVDISLLLGGTEKYGSYANTGWSQAFAATHLRAVQKNISSIKKASELTLVLDSQYYRNESWSSVVSFFLLEGLQGADSTGRHSHI